MKSDEDTLNTLRLKSVEKISHLRNETLPPPHQTLSLVSKTSLESFRILTKIFEDFLIFFSEITCFQIINTLESGHPANGDLLLSGWEGFSQKSDRGYDDKLPRNYA